jgi:hypothetical protein
VSHFVKLVTAFRQAALVGGLLCLGGGLAGAQTLSISANPPAMIISTAVAGSNPTSVTNATTTYTTKTNIATNKLKITGRVTAILPPGMSLEINLTPVTSGVSNGSVVLTTVAQDLMGPITNTTNQTKTITYKLNATAAAGVVASTTRTVTLTLTAWP